MKAELSDPWGSWVGLVVKRPAVVLLAIALVSAAAAVYAARNLGINADTRVLVSDDLDFRRRQRELLEAFNTLDTHSIFVVIDADSPLIARRAAADMAARLHQRPDLFTQILVPGGGPFFDRHALLYLEPDALQDLTDRLSTVQPFLAELARDHSVVGIADLLRQALRAEREGRGTGLELSGALERLGLAVDAAIDGRRAPDPWSREILGVFPDDARRRVVAVRPVLDYSILRIAEAPIRGVREAVRELNLVPENGVKVRITGEPAINYEEQDAIRTQSRKIAVVAFLLFTGTVCFALRSLRVVLALVGSLLASLIWANAFAAAAVGHLNQVSAGFNVIIIGLGGELGIHFCMRYMEVLSSGRSRREAAIETARSVGRSLFSSACTTSIGLYVFLLTDFRGVAQMGLIAGTGMYLSLLSTFTVLPALLTVGSSEHRLAAPVAPAWLTRLTHVPLRHARSIRVAAALLAAGSLVLLPRVRFDYNQLNIRDPGTESVQALNDLLESSAKTPWTIDVIAPNLDAAKRMAGQLARLPVVERAITLEDFVPKHQEEKIEALKTAQYFVPEQFDDRAPPSDTAQIEALRALRDEARRLAEDPGSEPLRASARSLSAALDRFSSQSGNEARRLQLLRSNVVGSLAEQLGELRPMLNAGHVRFEDLPADLVEQMLSADGRARVQVFPREDVSKSRALELFVAGVREVAPEATGTAVWLIDWGAVAWTSMLQALFGGVACMMVVLLILWRSVWDTLLAFSPLFLAAALTCAALALLGQPFNFATVVVLPMMIGMGVDSGVHLVHRHRSNPENVDVLDTSTARAVFFSALTTMLSFGTLGFASHRGMAAVGQLLMIGVGMTLLCYVVILPAVLEWDDRRRRRGASAFGESRSA